MNCNFRNDQVPKAFKLTMKNNKELAVRISLVRVFSFFLINILSPANADQPFCSYKEISDALSAPLRRELRHWPIHPSTRSSDFDNRFCTYNLWETIEKNVDSIHETDSARLNTAGSIFLCQYYRSLISGNPVNPNDSEHSILVDLRRGSTLEHWIGYRPTVLSVQEEREYIFDIVIFLLGRFSYRKDPLRCEDLINLLNLRDCDRLWANGSSCLHFLQLVNNRKAPCYLYPWLFLCSIASSIGAFLLNEESTITAITFLAISCRMIYWEFKYIFLTL